MTPHRASLKRGVHSTYLKSGMLERFAPGLERLGDARLWVVADALVEAPSERPRCIVLERRVPAHNLGSRRKRGQEL